MHRNEYGFSTIDQGLLTGQTRLVIGLSDELADWSDGAIKYAAAHEFAHQYLRHPVWIKRFNHNDGQLMKSFFEQQAIEWCEYVWPFKSEKIEAMKFMNRWAL